MMVSQIDPTPTGRIPVVTRGADTVDLCPFLTREAGAGWCGFPGGKDFS
jgi:hypothetical protein